MNNQQLCDAINQLAYEVNALAREKGWWDTERNIGESIALMHSELSEALEALRDPKCDHLCDKCLGTGRVGPVSRSEPCAKCGGSGRALAGSRFAEELADCVIRILDLCGGRDIDLGAAIIAKHRYNATRPRRHGKEF